MKCIRVIEYEAESENDVRTHLKRTLLSIAPIVRPGQVVPGVGRIFGGAGLQAPRVTIRLLEERWDPAQACHNCDDGIEFAGGRWRHVEPGPCLQPEPRGHEATSGGPGRCTCEEPSPDRLVVHRQPPEPCVLRESP